MNVRKILVAASAAAILAGSSYGALAGSWGVSKGQSSSSIHVVAKADPVDGWYGHSPEGSSVNIWAKGWQSATAPNGGSAGSTSGTFGGGSSGEVNISNYNHYTGATQITGSTASAFGGTSGSACAGSACSAPSVQY